MAGKVPCSRCGVESTPLWRTGPNGEPTLCNACGSRWKTCGDLQNYTPKNATSKGNGVKVTYVGKSQIQKDSIGSEGDTTSGRSTISYSNKNIERESEIAKEVSGLAYPSFPGPHIPRRKRSKLAQYVLTPVGMLQRKLLHILHQPEFAKYLQEEEELLITQDNQMSSDEIGLGCIMLESPGSDSKNK